MTKILATLGPLLSKKKDIKFFIENCDVIRFNLSHNTLLWHKKKIDLIKKFKPEKLILVDIPGIKPRTLNEKIINIAKGQVIGFSYYKKGKNIINISNPLPRTENKIRFFSLSDGNYHFKFLNLSNNILWGKATQNFPLKPKKGLNIPYSIYDDEIQEKFYFSFLRKIINIKYDCVGLSFIQSSKVIEKIKKKYPEKLIISKIENYLGYKNRISIIKSSDAIMIDRGDLSAELGIEKLSLYSNKIIEDSKILKKPIIIATENLNSLIDSSLPTKSDIINLDYYLDKKIDFIMLSDETATSNFWKSTLKWLNNYLKVKKKNENIANSFTIEKLLESLSNETVIIFSKKGFIFNKINTTNVKKIILFTENKKTYLNSKLKARVDSYLVKFPKIALDNFLFKNIKKLSNKVFKENKYIFLVHLMFPRKGSRANSISLIHREDFKNSKKFY
jgi:pyruvate kinase